MLGRIKIAKTDVRIWHMSKLELEILPKSVTYLLRVGELSQKQPTGVRWTPGPWHSSEESLTSSPIWGWRTKQIKHQRKAWRFDTSKLWWHQGKAAKQVVRRADRVMEFFVGVLSYSYLMKPSLCFWLHFCFHWIFSYVLTPNLLLQEVWVGGFFFVFCFFLELS